ncbi:MAG: hypothetical protein P1U65_07650 [Minwuia sp.]|nr:hypothetical protein [Minwuia sp.]
MAKAKNRRKFGKKGKIERRGRPRLKGDREPNGRLQRGGSGDDRAVGATPEQRLRKIATAAMTVGIREEGAARQGTDLTGAPLDLLFGAGLVDDETYRALMVWRELHRRIVGAPAPAGRERTGTAADVSPAEHQRWRALTEAMTARQRGAVFAIAVQECWPAWIMARDGWTDPDSTITADGKRCQLFRAGAAALVAVEGKSIQSLASRAQRRLTDAQGAANVINGASISGPETGETDGATLHDTHRTAAAR